MDEEIRKAVLVLLKKIQSRAVSPTGVLSDEALRVAQAASTLITVMPLAAALSKHHPLDTALTIPLPLKVPCTDSEPEPTVEFGAAEPEPELPATPPAEF